MKKFTLWLLLLGCAPALTIGKASAADTPGVIENDEDTNPVTKPMAPLPTLDEAFQQIKTYKFGDSRGSLDVIADAVRASKPADQAALAKRLAGLLGPNSTPDCKRFVCRQLRLIGGAESVPALAALLRDEEMSHMARYALEPNPTPEAGAALRAALGQLKGKALAGVVTTLGQRRDTAAGAAIAPLVGNADAAVRSAAVAALGDIGGPLTTGNVKPMPIAVEPEVVFDALLKIADRKLDSGQTAQAAATFETLYRSSLPAPVRAAALRGLALSRPQNAAALLTEALSSPDRALQQVAAGLVFDLPDAAAAELAAQLPKQAPAAQTALLDAMSGTGKPVFREAALGAAASADASVRVAALRALGTLGDTAAVPLLAKAIAAGGTERDAASTSLERLRGAGVDAAIVAQLDTTAPAPRAVLLKTLAARAAASAIPALFKFTADSDPGVRVASLNALGALAGEKEIPALLALLSRATPNELGAAEKALGAAVGKVAKPADRATPLVAALNQPGAAVPVRASLLRVLVVVGGPDALAAVTTATKEANAEVQDAAIRALATATDLGAAPALLDLAKTAPKPAQQILALRGYVRLAGDTSLKKAERLKMYADAMSAAQRPDEKRLVLAGLGSLNDVAALALVTPALEDEAIREEAAATVVSIVAATVDKMPKTAVANARAATQKVVDVSKDEPRRKQAAELIDKLKGK